MIEATTMNPQVTMDTRVLDTRVPNTTMRSLLEAIAPPVLSELEDNSHRIVRNTAKFKIWPISFL